jgi:hypothetical protein
MQALFYITVGLLVITLVALSMAAYADPQTPISCPAGPGGILNCTTVPTGPIVRCSGAPTVGCQQPPLLPACERAPSRKMPQHAADESPVNHLEVSESRPPSIKTPSAS